MSVDGFPLLDVGDVKVLSRGRRGLAVLSRGRLGAGVGRRGKRSDREREP